MTRWLNEITWDDQGLVPVIAQDAESGEVLMFAWMNREALRLTVETGIAHFWTRSRQKIWKKGEESGNVLAVCEIRTDCDQDVLWLKARIAGEGVACHTGARSCFYRRLEPSINAPEGAVLSFAVAKKTPHKG